MSDFVVSVRNTRKKGQRRVFGAEPGPTKFLRVPDKANPTPAQEISKSKWVDAVLAEAESGCHAVTGEPVGDVLVFIHGYNTGPKDVIVRHRQLKRNLKDQGYCGALVSFDWPSAESAFNYLEDRDDARATARRFRDDCISLLVARQVPGCGINIHLLAYSLGAFVVRQSFTEADEKAALKNRPWTVSQVALVGADISRRSLRDDASKSESLYRHCVRLTNYQNPFDSVLKLSDTKRIGVAPRAGRVGLPRKAPRKAVNVDCGSHYEALRGSQTEGGIDFFDTFSHSWFFEDAVFAADLVHTISGDIDRYRIPTRRLENNALMLGGEEK